jgi:hypothetical protein
MLETGYRNIYRHHLNYSLHNTFTAGATFDEKTTAVIALRNINLLPAARKLQSVLEDHNQERSVRSAAMSGLKPLLKEDPEAFRHILLPIFYDVHEDSELRNTAIQWILIAAPEENIFQEVAVSIWTEKNHEVKNFVSTLLKSLSGTTRPCLSRT